MFNRLLRQQLLDLLHTQKLERRLHEAVEQESEIHQHGKADDLQPLERLPTEAERDDPDEERAARVDSRARGGADGAGDGEAEEVEASGEGVSMVCRGGKGGTYPMLIMIKILDTNTA